jgi:hypothetical protein
MSAQAYEKVFSLNRAMNGGEAEMFFDLPLDDHSDVILIPQSEYNSLLEWVEDQYKEVCMTLQDAPLGTHRRKRAAALKPFIEEIKERLTSLNK